MKKFKRVIKYSLITAFLSWGVILFQGQHWNTKVIIAKADSVIEIQNKEEQMNKLRLAMLNREEEVTLKYNGNKDDLENNEDNLFAEIFAIDDKSTSTDGDYLKNIFRGYKIETTYSSMETEITYRFTYDETLQETAKVDTKIKEALKKMNLNTKSDYQKIKLIHDYIVNLLAYDKSLNNYSAYSAITKKVSTCQGYSLLTYKMLTEAKIPCRIITGVAGAKNPENHAWNIVKLQGKWYNLDTTWDDPVTSTGKQVLQYDYFLKSTKDFKNHTREKEYKTAQFMKAYPMSTKSFTKAMDKGKK